MILVADQDFHTVEAPFHEAFFTHTSTSPNLQIIASLDVARRQMELEGYELVSRAIGSRSRCGPRSTHPLISKYFRSATPDRDDPRPSTASGLQGLRADLGRSRRRFGDGDEFFLDPTRITLLCGSAGYDGTQFKGCSPSDYDIQINKTSRNSVLVQININNTRSDAPSDQGAGRHGARHRPAPRRGRRRARSRVRGARQVPDEGRARPAELQPLPRRVPRQRRSGTRRAHARGFYLAYEATAREYIRLNSQEIDERLKNGPELVSAKFVIPYRRASRSWCPGQVITHETIDLHAQARRQGDPRLQRVARVELS